MSLKNHILSFEVSSHSCSVAVSIGPDILVYEEDLRSSVQAEILIPLIEKALKSIKYDYSKIDYLALNNGPGSFTAIRIALAAAEGILVSSNIKSVVISNFEMSYYRLLQQVKFFDKAVILLDAYREQLYYQNFNYFTGQEDCGLIDINKISDFFAVHQGDRKIVCAGNGSYKIYNKVRNMKNVTILPRFSRINAVQICRFADEKIRKREFGNLMPLYIRPPDAKLSKK